MKPREKRRQAGTATFLLERTRIASESCVPQVEPAVLRERRSGPRRPRREHAVEHVDPARNHLEDPLGVSEPHEVARMGRSA